MTVPRYCPQIPLPDGAYVPGQTPRPHDSPATGDPQTDFRLAADLFNHGYYWEAHEVWESLWIAAGRRGAWALLLQGLIKLAAAGVKCREGRREGVRRHAVRAGELVRQAEQLWTADAPDQPVTWAWSAIIDWADALAAAPFVDVSPSTGGRRVWEWTLNLQD